jgi:hypothetical protein
VGRWTPEAGCGAFLKEVEFAGVSEVIVDGVEVSVGKEEGCRHGGVRAC